jgi:hypothetical protein
MFWLPVMHWVSLAVPSELKIGEMVCNDCSHSLIVTSSSSILILFEESADVLYRHGVLSDKS